ncbi:MAG TPA: DUF2917 domain-containing protein [Anaerolineales bacterium]
MNLTIQHPTDSKIKLQRREFVTAQKMAAGTTLVCEQGVLWMTRANDIQDYMLKPGDRLVLKDKSSVLIEALSEARLSIVNHN